MTGRITAPKGSRPPYASTEVEHTRSQMQINELLAKFGITDYQWSTSWSIGRVQLQFVIQDSRNQNLGIRLVPPAFTVRQRIYDEKTGRSEMKDVPNWDRSFRLLLFYLKAKLEAVAWGLSKPENEFLAETLVYTPDGRERVVADVVLPAINNGRLALEPPPEHA